MRIAWTMVATAALLSCAQGGDDTLAELQDCGRVPQAIVFRREPQGVVPGYVIRRYERYSQSGWIKRAYKNPESSFLNGPLHARNCASFPFGDSSAAPPDAVQRLTFGFKTSNYFGSGIADHLAILMRASFDRTEATPGGTQTGRGMALFANAIYAESFSLGLGAGAPFAPQDNTWYSVEMLATRFSIAMTITDPGGSVTTVNWQDTAARDQAGYGFAALCAFSENASCEYPQGSYFASTLFEIHFTDIAVSWSFSPS